jgi:SHS2 domain-containing protein
LVRFQGGSFFPSKGVSIRQFAGTEYEFFEHTADIGVRVEAPDLKALFSKAGLAVFDIMAKRTGAAQARGSGRKGFAIELTAENLEELFVAWLNELLSLSVSESVIFTSFSFTKLDETHCAATAWGESASGFEMRTEIKAATYHQLSLKRAGRSWKAEVIFDV